MNMHHSSRAFDRTHPSKQKDSVSPPVKLLDDKVHLQSFLLSVNEERRESSHTQSLNMLKNRRFWQTEILLNQRFWYYSLLVLFFFVHSLNKKSTKHEVKEKNSYSFSTQPPHIPVSLPLQSDGAIQGTPHWAQFNTANLDPGFYDHPLRKYYPAQAS